MKLTDAFWAAMALASGFGPKERADGSLAWGVDFYSLAPEHTDGARAVYHVLGMPVHEDELATIAAALRLVGPGVAISLHSIYPHSEIRDHVREVVRLSLARRGTSDEDPLFNFPDDVLHSFARLLRENVAEQSYELWQRSLPPWSLARNISFIAPARFDGNPPGSTPVPVSAWATGLGLNFPVPADWNERQARLRVRPGR